MLVLGIETSCDETAVALLQIDQAENCQILHEEIASQIDLHALYGGVVPELAAREHLSSLPLMMDRAIKVAEQSQLAIDLVAVTQGPGLKGCLLIGIEFAKGFCLGKNISLIGVNHIEGHLLAGKLDSDLLKNDFLALVVSGGHTEIIKVKALGQYEALARTIDDAAGEAFDKSANLLGFEYPGGASLAALADSVSSSRFDLPKVMREQPGFSFSGLKTAVALLVKKNLEGLKDPQIKAELAYSIQNAIVDNLVFKVKREIENHNPSALTITGGVACNYRLSKKLKETCAIPVIVPQKRHCVDNAAMIALAGGLKFQNASDQQRSAMYPHEVRPRWPVEQ